MSFLTYSRTNALICLSEHVTPFFSFLLCQLGRVRPQQRNRSSLIALRLCGFFTHCEIITPLILDGMPTPAKALICINCTWNAVAGVVAVAVAVVGVAPPRSTLNCHKLCGWERMSGWGWLDDGLHERRKVGIPRVRECMCSCVSVCAIEGGTI